MTRRVLATLFCAALVAVGVALGAAQKGGSTGSPALASTLACAHGGKAIGRPAEVPSAVLPPATTLTSIRHLGPGRTVVTGVVPRGLRSAVDFYVRQLPRAGYRLGQGDAEMDEAEALFSGRGIQGKWRVRAVVNCPGAVNLALFVRA